jgi:RimJ/RimL family protein N-acetyltransferase
LAPIAVLRAALREKPEPTAGESLSVEPPPAHPSPSHPDVDSGTVIERSDMFDRRVAHIEPWGAGDLPLLEKLNDPEMTRYVGGPESPEKLAERQSRFEKADSRQYKVVVETGGEGVGWVGYWERTWRDQLVWETGWAVIPSFQGRGIAGSATAHLIEQARAEQRHRFVHAFPMVENAPSNTICRKLGFTLLGEIDFPARQGGFVRCNDWRLDLFAKSDVRPRWAREDGGGIGYRCRRRYAIPKATTET